MLVIAMLILAALVMIDTVAIIYLATRSRVEVLDCPFTSDALCDADEEYDILFESDDDG